MSKKIILLIAFVFSAFSLHAKECPNDDFKKDIKALRMDIITLANKLKSLELQQKSSLVNLRNGVDSNNSDIASLWQELDELKHQVCTQPIELLGRLEEQQKGLVDSKELEHILIKYGNNPYGMSALHYAIKIGDINAVYLLIANGADVNTVQLNYSGEHLISALSMAAHSNQLEIAQLLIQHGADVNFFPYEKCTYAISYAVEFASGELVTLLIENGAMLDRTHQINQRPDKYTYTPLHVAVKAGNLQAVIALVEGGAKINGNSDGHVEHFNQGTPLDWAACLLRYSDNPRNLDLVTYLVENGGYRRATSKGACPVIMGYLESKGR